MNSHEWKSWLTFRMKLAATQDVEQKGQYALIRGMDLDVQPHSGLCFPATFTPGCARGYSLSTPVGVVYPLPFPQSILPSLNVYLKKITSFSALPKENSGLAGKPKYRTIWDTDTRPCLNSHLSSVGGRTRCRA
jgi:hypothetical protein